MPISRFVVFQIFALAITAGVYQSVIYQKASVILFCVTFSHYVMALIYSRHYIMDLVRVPQNYLPFTLLTVGGITLFVNEFSAFYLFALHHALNESYIRGRFESQSLPERQLKWIQASCFFLHLPAYMIIGQPLWLLKSNVPLLLFYALVLLLTSAVYFFLIFKNRKSFSVKQIVTILFAEFALFCLLLVDWFIYDIGFMQVIFYHVTFWVFFPAANIWTYNRYKGMTTYVLLTLLTLGFFFYYSPLITKNWTTDFVFYRKQFEIWSYFHILTSFALSKANPNWINRCFKDRSQLIA